jgi:4-amino-4-deoxy-L-arabinose transferase-like glycosyltransferase
MERTRTRIFSRPVIAFFALLTVMLFLKVNGLRAANDETDELIYRILARQVFREGHYSLQGTPALNALPREIYDKPLFHHPPLFVFLIGLVQKISAPQFQVVVPWLAHFAILFGMLALIYQSPRKNLLLYLIAAGVVVDPLLCFISQRLWIDGLLAALCFLSFLFFVQGLQAKSRRRLWFVGGVLWGLALLTKLPAAYMAVPIGFLLFCEYRDKRSMAVLKDFAFFALPAFFLSVPWFLLFYANYGKLTWTGPTQELIAQNPFIRLITQRPWFFYLTEFPLLNPFMILAVVLQIAKRKLPDRLEAALWLYILTVVGVMTILGAKGGFGFQMRHLSMAMPALYWLLVRQLSRYKNTRIVILLAVLCALVLSWNFSTVRWTDQYPDAAEIIPLSHRNSSF